MTNILIQMKQIEDLIHRYYPEVVEIRRYLHQNPELSYKEFKTTSLIVNELESLGFDIECPLETGCIGVLRGGIESNRVIAFRADIDALPIQETGDHKKEFLSKIPGVSHCCGHDVHTANLLGTARIFAALKDKIQGKIVLIFQPGEEKPPGGGKLMMQSGVLQKHGVQVIYGLHSYPFAKPGTISVIKGPMMARPDEFTLIVNGKGGHAAIPQKAVDPIVIASQIVTVLQSIITRNINPLEPAVLTIGKIEGGSAHNVIPDKVTMLGTIRTFSKEVTMLISDQIEKVSRGLAEAHGAEIEYHFSEGYPAVINTPWAVDKIVDAATEINDVEILNLPEPIMAGEDFSFYLEEIPGSYMYLGSGSSESGSDQFNWHHPFYNVDERAMKTGMKLFSALAFAKDHLP
jgi:amidohydrolase